MVAQERTGPSTQSGLSGESRGRTNPTYAPGWVILGEIVAPIDIPIAVIDLVVVLLLIYLRNLVCRENLVDGQTLLMLQVG